MKVKFKHASGREQFMQERYAAVLQKLGRGVYLTRDIAQPVSAPEYIISDAVRSFAEEMKVDLARVTPTGQGGRILKKDVEALIPAPPASDKE